MNLTGLGVARVAHVDDGDAAGEHVPDVGIAIEHVDLDAVAAPTLIAMADEREVVANRPCWLITHDALSPHLIAKTEHKTIVHTLYGRKLLCGRNPLRRDRVERPRADARAGQRRELYHAE